MAVQTLNSIPSLTASRPANSSPTYSIAPNHMPAPIPEAVAIAVPSDLNLFLEQENPLGCIRGVMWVMGFNAAVFLLGFMIWQAFRFLG